MIPGVVSPESPEHHIRNSLQIIALAQYATTATGEPGRILTDDEYKAVIDRLFKAVRQLEAAEADKAIEAALKAAPVAHS